MSSAKIRLQQAAKEFRKATDTRYSKSETALVAGAVGSSYVTINGNIAKAQLPDGTSGEVEVVNSGRPASAVYTTKEAGGAVTVVRGVSTSGGTSGDIATAIAIHKAEADPHPVYLTSTEADALYVGKLGTGQYQVPVTGATPYQATYTALSSFAGNGLTFTTQFNVGAGTLINVASTTVSLANGSAQYQVPVTGASPFTPAYTSLSTFAGNGLIFGSGVFNVGAGAGITANVSDVAVNYDSARGLTIVGSALAANIDTSKGLAFISGAIGVTVGVGMVLTGGNVTMGTPSSLDFSTSNSATTGTHTHSVVTSNNPGGSAKILASSISGGLTLVTFTATTSVTTPRLTNSGDLLIDPSGNVNFPNAQTVRSTTFSSGLTIQGWQINEVTSGTSALTIGTISVDELRAKVFVADEVRVDRGEQVWGKSFGVVESEFTTPSAVGGDGVNVYFENSPAIAGAIFTTGDWLRFRIFDRTSGFTIANVWGQVYSTSSGAVPGYLLDSANNRQRWRFVLRSGPSSYEVKKGVTVIDYGASGQPYIFLSAVDPAGAPYIKFNVWAGSDPYTAANHSTTTIIGNLKSIFGITNENGIAAGNGFTATDSYFKAATTGVLQNNITSTWTTGGATFASINSTNGFRVESINSSVTNPQRAYSFAVSGVESGGVYHYYNNTFTEAALTLNQYSASRNNNLYLLCASDNGRVSRIYMEARETAASSASLDLMSDIGGDTSQVSIAAGLVKIESSQFLVRYSNGSGGDGFVNAPVYSFTDDSNTGIYRPSADTLAITTGGANRLVVSSSAFNISPTTVTIGAVVSGTNLNKLTARHVSGAVTLGLASSAFGMASAFLANASLLSEASSMTATGACIYRGTQYTGNVTAPGMLYFDANANFWGFYIGQPGLAEGAGIAWMDKLRIDKYGNLLANGMSAYGGQGVFAMKSCIEQPLSAPAAGGILYIIGGTLWYMGGSGTITKLANA